MSEPKELILTFRDLHNLVPQEARWAALAAAEEVLKRAGVTLQECLRVGANKYPKFQVGEVVNFFDPDIRVANAWLDAMEAAFQASGTLRQQEPQWILRIAEQPTRLRPVKDTP